MSFTMEEYTPLQSEIAIQAVSALLESSYISIVCDYILRQTYFVKYYFTFQRSRTVGTQFICDYLLLPTCYSSVTLDKKYTHLKPSLELLVEESSIIRPEFCSLQTILLTTGTYIPLA